MFIGSVKNSSVAALMITIEWKVLMFGIIMVFIGIAVQIYVVIDQELQKRIVIASFVFLVVLQ